MSVSDRGDGMPPDFLATATRRFARAEVARTKPGSGLGLSLVEAVVVQAGGALRLCHAGEHVSYGSEVPVACDHGAAMTVTVLLPTI
jgi:signal transduction histidine kinase